MGKKINIDRDLLVSYLAVSENVLRKSVASYDTQLKIDSSKALGVLPEIYKIIEDSEKNNSNSKYSQKQMF